MQMINRWPQLSKPVEGDVLRVVSHGGGVQTSALLLMAARGDIGPMPHFAVMADTGGESTRTYAYLEWLRDQVPFPILMARRSGPTLSELAISVANGERERDGAALPPWFSLSSDGRPGMMPKHCSGTFKRDVVTAKIRELLGYDPGVRVTGGTVKVEQWLGISKDEIWRVQAARKKYIMPRYPLIEADMTRQDCIRWMRDRQYPVPPKSSCVFCPFRTNAQWRELRDNSPEDFAEACRVDAALRAGGSKHDGSLFVHKQRVPLSQADLSDDHIDQLPLPLGADCDSCGM